MEWLFIRKLKVRPNGPPPPPPPAEPIVPLSVSVDRHLVMGNTQTAFSRIAIFEKVFARAEGSSNDWDSEEEGVDIFLQCPCICCTWRRVMTEYKIHRMREDQLQRQQERWAAESWDEPIRVQELQWAATYDNWESSDRPSPLMNEDIQRRASSEIKVTRAEPSSNDWEPNYRPLVCSCSCCVWQQIDRQRSYEDWEDWE